MNPESHLDLELLAAQLRRCTDDLSLHGGMLLAVLSSALPPALVGLRREGRWKARLGGREPAVLGVSVTLGELRFELDRAELQHVRGELVVQRADPHADHAVRAQCVGLALHPGHRQLISARG